MSENKIQTVEITDTDLFTGTSEDLEAATETDLSTIVEHIVADTDEATAYQVWNLMNATFKALGIEQSRPSQMMYNYTRNGMIAKRTKGQTAKTVRYTNQEIKDFLVKFVTKHTA